MHVGHIMSTDLITVAPNTSLLEANKITKQKKIDHLLVVDKNKKMLGIVSDRDLKQSWASPATTLSQHELNYLLDQLTVELIMAKNIISVPPSTTIERAALIMQDNNIHSLPVVKDDDLLGIITTEDVTQVLLQALGINYDSSRFTVLVKDRTGVLADVALLLRDHDINIISLVTWPIQQTPSLYQLVMRVAAKDGEAAIAALTKKGFKVLTEYVEDYTPYLSEDI